MVFLLLLECCECWSFFKKKLKHLQGFRRDRVAPEMGKRWRLLLCVLVKSRGGAEPRR